MWTNISRHRFERRASKKLQDLRKLRKGDCSVYHQHDNMMNAHFVFQKTATQKGQKRGSWVHIEPLNLPGSQGTANQKKNRKQHAVSHCQMGDRIEKEQKQSRVPCLQKSRMFITTIRASEDFVDLRFLQGLSWQKIDICNGHLQTETWRPLNARMLGKVAVGAGQLVYSFHAEGLSSRQKQDNSIERWQKGSAGDNRH